MSAPLQMQWMLARGQAATAFLDTEIPAQACVLPEKLHSGQEETTSKNKLKFNLRSVPSVYSIMKKEDSRNRSVT